MFQEKKFQIEDANNSCSCYRFINSGGCGLEKESCGAALAY
jgi:hypothetical protein